MKRIMHRTALSVRFVADPGTWLNVGAFAIRLVGFSAGAWLVYLVVVNSLFGT